MDRLENITNGVFGFADRVPDYPKAVKYQQRWESWESGDAGACPCCSNISSGYLCPLHATGTSSGAGVYVVTGAKRYYLTGRYLPMTQDGQELMCGGKYAIKEHHSLFPGVFLRDCVWLQPGACTSVKITGAISRRFYGRTVRRLAEASQSS